MKKLIYIVLFSLLILSCTEKSIYNTSKKYDSSVKLKFIDSADHLKYEIQVLSEWRIRNPDIFRENAFLPIRKEKEYIDSTLFISSYETVQALLLEKSNEYTVEDKHIIASMIVNEIQRRINDYHIYENGPLLLKDHGIEINILKAEVELEQYPPESKILNKFLDR